MMNPKFMCRVLAILLLFAIGPMPVHAETEIYYVVSDHLGTPHLLVDENRHVVWQAEYDEFGKATILVEEEEFNLRFPGQYYDKETGLNYNYYRDYDPSTGRYVQSDPIGLKGGINTYLYADGDPIQNTDFFGLGPFKIIELCAQGYKIIKKVNFKEAVEAAKRGENILAPSHQTAKKVAKAASEGKRPIRDPAHKPQEGQRPHYHPNPRNGSHVFYNIAAALTITQYVKCEDGEENCIKGTLAQVVDIFNPLSTPQDIISTMDIISE